MSDAPAALARQRAEQSIAVRFNRVMNATTSRWGVLSDPPVVAVTTAPALVALLAAMRLEASPTVILALEVVTALPITIAVVITLALLGARRGVVEWLSGAPFPIENANALLNGLGESLEVTFAGACPSTPELNEALERVSPEAFVVSAPDAAGEKAKGAPPALVEVRIGVVESKRNPAASNHARYRRVRALVEEALGPLSARFPIAEVRVK